MTSASYFQPVLVAVLTLSHAAIAGPTPTPPAHSPELTHVQGTYVSLAVPKGFIPAQHFPGFIHEETGATLYVVEESLSGPEEHLLIEEKSSIGGVPFMHWRRQIFNEYTHRKVTIGALAPASATPQLMASMGAALQSAQLDPLREIPFLKPAFALQRTQGLREKRPLQASSSTWQTRTYVPADIQPSSPSRALLAASFKPACLRIPPTEIHPRDAKRLLVAEFLGEPGNPLLYKYLSVTPVTIDGLRGWELVPKAKGEVIGAYQMILREGTGCFMITGLFNSPSARNRYLASFRAAARSFKRLDGPDFEPPATEEDFLGLTQVRGTRLFLAVPPGFVESKQFAGFIEEGSGAFIEVSASELGGGSVDVKKELWGIPHHTWVASIRDIRDGATIMVNITLREADVARLQKDLMKTLESMRVKRSAEIVRPDRNFTLTPLDGMVEQEWRRMKLRRPVPVTPRTSEPEFLTLKSLARRDLIYKYNKEEGPVFSAGFWTAGSRIPFDTVNASSAKGFFEKNLHESHVGPEQIDSISPIEIDGLKGWEITAIQNKESKEPEFLYQVILPDGVGFYSLKSRFPLRQRVEYLPLAQTLARSFKRL